MVNAECGWMLLYLKWTANGTYCTAPRTLLSVTPSLDGKGVWGRRDTWTCTAESLCRPPEGVTVFFIVHTLRQNENLNFKKVIKSETRRDSPGTVFMMLRQRRRKERGESRVTLSTHERGKQ